MNDCLNSAGRILFALAIAVFGVEHYLYAHNAIEIAPLWMPKAAWREYAAAVFLVVVSVALLIKIKARTAALLLGAALLLLFIIVHVPRLYAHPLDGIIRTRAFETLAIGGTALILSSVLQGKDSAYHGPVDIWAKAGLFLIAICMVVFGVQHFMYALFIATLIPAWIPGHLFLAYFTGVAFIAAGLSFLARTKVRLTALPLALMFFLWVLVLHLPRAVAARPNGDEWASTFVALAMGASALLIAGTFSSSRRIAS